MDFAAIMAALAALLIDNDEGADLIGQATALFDGQSATLAESNAAAETAAADSASQLEALAAEVQRLKAVNFDLLMQVGAAPEEAGEDTPADDLADAESISIDDLFTKEGDE